jgi:hypothetical protein
MNIDESILEDIFRFDGDFHADAGIRPGVEAMPVGAYDLEVLDCDLTRAKTTALDPILEIQVRVLAGPTPQQAGFAYSWTHWLVRQEDVNRLGGALCTLGFAAEVNAPTGFSRALPDILTRLPGLRFRARKTERRGDSKVFHNLVVDGLISPAQGRHPRAEPARPAAQALPNGPAGGDMDNQIPF